MRVEAEQIQSESVGTTPPKKSAVRWPVVLILGGLLATANVVWITYMQAVWNQGFPSVICIYFNTIFTLVVVAVANAGVRRAWPGSALSPTEMLVIFVMTNVGISVAMLGEYIIAQLAFPYQFRDMDARWSSSLLPYWPKWLTVSDPQAAKDYYLGNANLWKWSSIRPWLLPMAGWGLFVMAIVWTGICLSAIVYNRFRRQERLSFPLLQIPLMITEQRSTFYKTWLFWIAFGLAAGVDILNALHSLYPSVPGLVVKRQAFHMVGLPRPWSSLSPVLYSFNPFLIGLEYFLPLDLLFSVFFFYWAARMQGVFFNAIGVEKSFSPDSAVAPYVREQSVGAILALLLFSLWMARGHWRESWQKARTFMPVDKAGAGAALGVLVMVAFLTFAGMPGWVAVLLVAVYLAVVVSLARIRAQYGPPGASVFLAAPGSVIYNVFGAHGLGTQGLSSIALVHWMEWDYAGHPMPDALEAHALTENRVSGRMLIVAILLGGLIGYVAAFGTALVTGYSLGHATARSGGTQTYYGIDACKLFSSRLSSPVSGLHADSVAATAFGAVVVLALQFVRTRFVAFPLHPVGYAVASAYTSTFMWSTAAVTWAFKGTLLRYCGLKGYRRAAPFFLGLVLGEFVVGSLLSIVSVATGIRLYIFWPY